MKYILLPVLFLFSCVSKAPQCDIPDTVTKLLDNCVNDGISIFRYQKDMLIKYNWDVFFADRLMSVEEINMIVPYQEERIKTLFESFTMTSCDSIIDFARLSVSSLTIEPLIVNAGTNVKSDLIPRLKDANKDGLFIMSKIYKAASSANPDTFHVLLHFIWEGNDFVVHYQLSEKNGQLFIQSRYVI